MTHINSAAQKNRLCLKFLIIRVMYPLYNSAFYLCNIPYNIWELSAQEVASSLPVKNTTVFGTSITFHLSVLNCTFVQVIVNSSVFGVLSGCDCVIFQTCEIIT